jgi:hypothetical protein
MRSPAHLLPRPMLRLSLPSAAPRKATPLGGPRPLPSPSAALMAPSSHSLSPAVPSPSPDAVMLPPKIAKPSPPAPASPALAPPVTLPPAAGADSSTCNCPVIPAQIDAEKIATIVATQLWQKLADASK